MNKKLSRCFLCCLLCCFCFCQGCLDLFVLIDPIKPIQLVWHLQSVLIVDTNCIYLVCEKQVGTQSSGMTDDHSPNSRIFLQASIEDILSTNFHCSTNVNKAVLVSSIFLDRNPGTVVTDANNCIWRVSNYSENIEKNAFVLRHVSDSNFVCIPLDCNDKRYELVIHIDSATILQ